MNVMMIGLSGCGKTSYMGALYRRFRDSPVGGFTIRATDKAADCSLVTTGKNLEHGIFPDTTDLPSEYNFKLRHDGVDVMDFKWTDYRGGLLLDVNAQEEYEKWERQLNGANAVIVFLDSSKMGWNASRHSHQDLAQMEAIEDLVDKVICRPSSELISVSFVLTKWDEWDVKSANMDEIRRLLDFMKIIEKAKNIKGLLTRTIVGQDGFSNIEWPFLLSMDTCLHEYARRIINRYEEAKTAAIQNYNRSSLIDSASSWLFGERSWKDLALSRIEEARQHAEHASEILKHLDEISKMLRDAAVNNDVFVRLF